MPSVGGVDDNVPPRGYGVSGRSTRGGWGVSGQSDTGNGVFAWSESESGVYSTSNTGNGVHGSSNTSYGVAGQSNSNEGVHGESNMGPGVAGYSGASAGVYGQSINANGVVGRSNNYPGVYGESYSSPGVVGVGNNFAGVGGYSNKYQGVYGQSKTGYGVAGVSNTGDGVVGESINGAGVLASSVYGPGVYGSSRSGLAAFLDGNVRITGNLTIDGTLQKAGGAFKIDHPLDPANKYLSHSFVESPDMKNVYDGVVVLDDKGEAEIELPDWFGALNKDFRYQLTAIGAPGPNLYIAEEISDDAATTSNYNNNKSRFKIAGGISGMKVSWQVTGIRKDPWANAHRISVEEDKPAKERGYYTTYPELFMVSSQKRKG